MEEGIEQWVDKWKIHWEKIEQLIYELENQASQYANNKEHETAVENYKLLIKLKPTSLFFLLLGNEYLNLRQFQKSIKWYRKCNGPSELVYAKYNSGMAYEAVLNYEEALKHYQQAIEVDENYYLAYNALGNCLIRISRYNEAIECFYKAIKIEPTYYDVYYSLGYTFNILSRFDEAIEVLNEAIKLNPTSDDCYYELGSSYHNKKEYDIALEKYDKAIELNQNANFDYKSFLLIELLRYDEALELYENFVKENPTNADGHNGLGIILSEIKEYDKAIEHFQLSINYETICNPSLQYPNLAFTYIKMKDYEKAEENLNKSLNVEERERGIYLHFCHGLLLYKLRKSYDKAIEEFKLFIGGLFHDLVLLSKYAAVYYYLALTIQRNYSENNNNKNNNNNNNININIEYNNKYDIYDIENREKVEKEVLENLNLSIGKWEYWSKSYYQRALIYMNRKEYNLALDDFKKVIQTNPKTLPSCQLSDKKISPIMEYITSIELNSLHLECPI